MQNVHSPLIITYRIIDSKKIITNDILIWNNVEVNCMPNVKICLIALFDQWIRITLSELHHCLFPSFALWHHRSLHVCIHFVAACFADGDFMDFVDLTHKFYLRCHWRLVNNKTRTTFREWKMHSQSTIRSSFVRDMLFGDNAIF